MTAPHTFTSARTRLTLGYTLFFAVVIGLFSIAFYVAQIRVLNHSEAIPERILTSFVSRQQSRAEQHPLVQRAINQRFAEATVILKRQLVVNLLFVDILAILSSAVVSYYLAGKTLDPLEKSYLLQQQFLADASHELRTPLSIIKAEIELGLKSSQLTDRQTKTLISAQEEVDTMTGLVDDILFLSRTGNGQNGHKYRPIDLARLVKKTVTKFQPAAAQKKINIVLDIQKTESKIKGDKELVSRLVGIILDNAIKYSLVGQEIKVTLKQKGNQLVLSVQDQGRGITTQDQAKIFDRFFRSDSARSSSGTGLGLSIAQSIVTKLKGKIRVTSQPGQGATFTITLPAMVTKKG